MGKVKAGLIGLGTFITGTFGTWHVGSFLGLKGRDLLVLRGGLALLVLILSAFLVWWLLRGRAKAPAPVADEGSEIDAAFQAARSRLAASPSARGARPSSLPTVLLVGAVGSAKTTAVVRSGLETELLAGEVFRGDTVISTRAVNLWYGGRTIFAEVGGRISADPSRWSRLLRHLQPPRLRTAVMGGTQPPRTVVLCVSCEDLVRSDASEAVPALARTFRSRLSELALALGVPVPIYVVFTKADKIPHFADYVRTLTREEIREIFGTTLPLEQGGAPATGDQGFKRIDRAFQRMFHSLASKRLKFLPREGAAEHVGGAYEFPREFRKVIPIATQLLAELARPSQLGISPVLRGFYFVGVRPFVVTDAVFNPVTSAAPVAEALARGATSVFNPAHQPQRAALAKAAAVPASRKVPQWLFLERFFPDVVLNDQVARALTRGGRQVSLLRRLLLGGAIAAGLGLTAGLLVSYSANRELLARTAVALDRAGGRTLQPDGLPSLDALRDLDQLRAELATLAKYEREGPPLRLRWGLYAGDEIYPDVRRGYFRAFDRLLFAAARDSVVLRLRDLPETPTQASDYGDAYTALKSYLITVSNPEKSTSEFLAPALARYWQGGTDLDVPRASLARGQFAFYADELRLDNPFRSELEGRTVGHAREYLRRFTGSEPIYRSMLSTVGSAIPPVNFARAVPGAAGLVRDTYIVPGAFTKPGWNAMQAAFADIDRYFKGDAWVIGEQAPVTADRAKLRDELRARYAGEYLSHWRAFLAAATVERFAGVSDGARKLATLSSNQSPLLALLALVSRHTAVDSVKVRPAFQPVHVVAPPGDTTKYIGEANEGYVNALIALQASLDQVSKATPDEAAAAATQALGDASQAKLATKQITNKFELDEAGRSHLLVQRLLEAPILYVEGSLQGVGPAALNTKGRAFCAPFQQVLRKFPFNPYGTAEAAVDEVGSLLAPGSGSLWTFVEGDLAAYVQRQGARFVEKPGSPVRISPAFLAFLGRAAEFSGSLYRAPGAPAAFTMTVRPTLSDAVPALTLTVDGRPARFTRTSAAAKGIAWSADNAQEATLLAQIDGRERQVLSYQGTWALFKLFQQADWIPREGGAYSVAWKLPGESGGLPLLARFDVHLSTGKPILGRDFFAGVACSGRITR